MFSIVTGRTVSKLIYSDVAGCLDVVRARAVKAVFFANQEIVNGH